jgi:hypothetical protein
MWMIYMCKQPLGRLTTERTRETAETTIDLYPLLLARDA